MVHEDIDKIVMLLDSMVDDSSIPRNVRSRIADAKRRLESSEDFAAKVSTAVYALDDVSNDINMPMHARTLIWNILSELERIKATELSQQT